MMYWTHKRAFAFAPLLAAVALVTACDDDPIEPEDPAEDVESVRLTVGGETVEIGSGDHTDITIPLGETTDVSAVFLDADGNEVGGLGGDFELNIQLEEGAEIATFERDASDPFAGTLTGDVEGDAEYAVQLYHIPGGHEDLEVHIHLTVE